MKSNTRLAQRTQAAYTRADLHASGLQYEIAVQGRKDEASGTAASTITVLTY